MRKKGLRYEAVHLFLGDEIRRRAKQKELTLEQVADFAGISMSQLYRVLAGECSPSLDTVAAIARTLQCRPRQLLP